MKQAGKGRSVRDSIEHFAQTVGAAVADQIKEQGMAAVEQVGKSLQRSLGIGGVKKASPAGTRTPAAKGARVAKAPGPAAKTPVATKEGRGAKSPAPAAPGGKRSPLEVDQVASKLLALIQKHPGLTMEKIASQMGKATRELTLPMQRLLGMNSKGEVVNEVKVRTQGTKRATTYWPAGAPAASHSTNGVSTHVHAGGDATPASPP